MVLRNYVIKDMGGKIEDAFGGRLLLPMAIAGFLGFLFSIIGTMLVKSAVMMMLKSSSTKRANIGNWSFYCLTLNVLLL